MKDIEEHARALIQENYTIYMSSQSGRVAIHPYGTGVNRFEIGKTTRTETIL